MRAFPLLALAAALAVAGCSDRGEPTASNAATAEPPSPATDAISLDPGNAVDDSAPADAPTVGGDGSQITLNPLSPKEIADAKLAGELGCSFTATGGAAPLLVAKGDAASKAAAMGVVKVADYVERIGAPGGFDALVKGPVFSGAGKTIHIALTGAAIGGGESPPRPASLTYDRADGAKRTIAGRWSCGP